MAAAEREVAAATVVAVLGAVAVSWDAWFPVITLVLGSVLAFVGSVAGPWILEDRAEKRRRRDRWADFQRDNLIALQEAIADNYTVAADYVILMREVAEQAGSLPRDLPFIPRQLMERQQATGVHLRQVAGRIDDPQVRELVDAYRDARRQWHNVASTESDKAQETAVVEAVNRVLDRAGELIRESWIAEPPRREG